MKATIATTGDLFDVLRQVTASKDTYVYPGAEKGQCRYFEPADWDAEWAQDTSDVYYPEHEDELVPGCIVGHVLAKLGVTPADVRENGCEGNTASGIEPILEAPPIVVSMLCAAQTAQDAGATWGVAFYAARSALDAYNLGFEEASAGL